MSKDFVPEYKRLPDVVSKPVPPISRELLEKELAEAKAEIENLKRDLGITESQLSCVRTDLATRDAENERLKGNK